MTNGVSGGRVANVRTRATQAHQKAVAFDIADIAGFLQEMLGQKLVAYIAGVSDPKTVGNWVRGEQAPRTEADHRLRTAFQIFHLLQGEESPHTVRAWFVGLNPQLDDDTPVDAIREGRAKDVLVAARAYIAGG